MSPPGLESDVPLLISRNPANGDILGEVETTPPGGVAGLVANAREAQRAWGALHWRDRRTVLERWWHVLAAEAEDLARTIRDEVGKPRGEAMAEVVMSLDAIRWTIRHGGRVLRDRRIGAGWQRWLLIPGATLRRRPLGVVGIVGTWNYPVLLNAPVIAQALAAGNAVVWKPSELASLSGARLRRSLETAGLPGGLVSTVFGGPDLGRALVAADLDKGVFTGGIASGRLVLGELASRGIPAIAELSGFDAAIVLPDAPRDSTIRALCWGAFVGAGQTCVAVKRIYIVGDPRPWQEGIASAAQGLRVGDPADSSTDLGPLISAAARDLLAAKVRAAVEAGATVRAGGEPVPGPGWFYRPTVLEARTPAPEAALAGNFGPVVLIRGVATADEAIAAANASSYGLAASAWGRNPRALRRVASRLEAGLVTLNEAVTPTGHASAPFGGAKTSGFGRTKGPLGALEFTYPQAVLARRPGGFRPQLFPYSTRMERLLAWYRWAFHGPRA